MPFRGEGDHTITIFSGELAVLLIDWRMLSGMLQRLPRKATEILVFPHLGVVDMALTPDPLQQDLFLCRSRVTTKLISYLHSRYTTTIT